MQDTQVLEVIEHADHDQPFCPHCSAPTIIVAGGNGALWQVCSDVLRPRTGLAGLVHRIQAPLHLRRLVLSAAEVTSR